MAVRAPRPCKRPGCCHLSRDGSGHCPEHKETEKAHNWSRTGGSSRGYGWKWKKLRDRIMRRDNRLCQYCIKYGIATPATEVDHVVPRSMGGDDHPDNLKAICRDCHKAKTAQESAHVRRQ